MIIGFGLIGGLVFWKGSAEVAKWMWIVSAAVGVLAVIVPPLSKPFYLVWMAVALIMGTIISHLILLIIFYLIITPVGLFMKMIGRDALKLKKKSEK